MVYIDADIDKGHSLIELKIFPKNLELLRHYRKKWEIMTIMLVASMLTVQNHLGMFIIVSILIAYNPQSNSQSEVTVIFTEMLEEGSCTGKLKSACENIKNWAGISKNTASSFDSSSLHPFMRCPNNISH